MKNDLELFTPSGGQPVEPVSASADGRAPLSGGGAQEGASITARDGALYRNGNVIPLPEADEIAIRHGYTCAEQLVAALSSNRVEVDDDDGRGGKPSASSMDRYFHCAGSPALERGMPPLPEQSVTKDGTDIHASLETGNDENLDLTPREIAEKLAGMEAAALAQWREDFGITGTPKVIREQRFWIRDRNTLDPIASSKPDVIYYTATHALCIDFKTGFANPTDSERNWQCRTQAVSFWSEFPQVEHIRAGIAASRLTSKLDLTDYTTHDLKRIEREILHIVWRSEQPDAPRVPGSHCRWCRAKAVCRENSVYGLILHHRLPVANNPDQLAIIDTVGRMSPSEMAFVYRRKSTMETAFDAIEARLKSLPSEELEAVGYKLAPGNETYPIPDVPAAFDTLVSSGLLTDEERKTVLTIGRGKIEEIVAEKRNITKKAAKALVIKTLSLTPKIGNPKLKAL